MFGTFTSSSQGIAVSAKTWNMSYVSKIWGGPQSLLTNFISVKCMWVYIIYIYTYTCVICIYMYIYTGLYIYKHLIYVSDLSGPVFSFAVEDL